VVLSLVFLYSKVLNIERERKKKGGKLSMGKGNDISFFTIRTEKKKGDCAAIRGGERECGGGKKGGTARRKNPPSLYLIRKRGGEKGGEKRCEKKRGGSQAPFRKRI